MQWSEKHEQDVGRAGNSIPTEMNAECHFGGFVGVRKIVMVTPADSAKHVLQGSEQTLTSFPVLQLTMQ